jgi:hypothetical protein
MDGRVKSLKGALDKSQKIAIGCPATSTSAAVPARPHLVDINVNNGGIDFTAYNWRYPGDLGNHTFGSLEGDCLLLRLAYKVTRMPQGNSRGFLTIAIEKAQAKNRWDINLSELATFAARKGIRIPEPRRASPVTDTALVAADNAALVAFRITYNNLT